MGKTLFGEAPVRRGLLIANEYSYHPDRENYVLDTPYEVSDCMRDFCEDRGYGVALMRDDPAMPAALYSTPNNIVSHAIQIWPSDRARSELAKLVNGVTPGHQLLLYYAGHGRVVRSEQGRSQQAIVPGWHQPPSQPGSDNARGEFRPRVNDPPYILGTELNKILCSSLPAGSQLITIFDSCQSNKMLGLNHNYTVDDIPEHPRVSMEAAELTGPETAHILSVSACSMEGETLDNRSIGHVLPQLCADLTLSGHVLTWRNLLVGLEERLQVNDWKPNVYLSSSVEIDWDEPIKF